MLIAISYLHIENTKVIIHFKFKSVIYYTHLYTIVIWSRGVQGPASTDPPAWNRPNEGPRAAPNPLHGRSRIGI